MKQIKTTFAGGELSEALDGRVDLSKYPTGAQLLENFYVTRFGGVSNRQGTLYIDDALGDVKLIPFRFSVTQTYVLEFGASKMRVIKDGGIVLTSRAAGAGYKWTASAVTGEWYCELTAGGDPSIIGAQLLYADGTLYSLGTLGALAAGEFAYGDNDTLGYSTIYMYSGTDPDSAFTTITSDYQVTSPYTFAQADAMTYAQSADTIFFAHKDVAPRSLTRTADDVWTFSTVSFTPAIDAPGDIVTAKTGFSTTARDWFYAISAKNSGGEESLPSADELVQGDIDWVSGDTVSLFWNSIVLSGTYKWTASGSGTAEYYLELSAGGDPSKSEPTTVYENLIAMTAGTVGSLAVGEWDYGDNDTLGYSTIYVRITAGADPGTKADGYLVYKDSDEVEYMVYKNYRGDWGWIGSVTAPWFLDDNVEGLITYAPKEANTVFASSGNYPQAVGFFQQRLMYARSDNQPQTVWASQPGQYTNFTISRPFSAEDSIEARLVSGGSVDEIRHLTPLPRKLLVFTEGSEWTFDHGDNSDALTPTNVQFRTQGFDGASTIRPLTLGNECLFIARNDADIKSFRYKAEFDAYVGNEMTLLVPHLFFGKTIVDWCYQQHPDNIVWIILNDGMMLSFTYIPDQEVWAFARHSTNGKYKRCASIPVDSSEDEVYFSVERTLNGTTKNRLEQLHSRVIEDIYDSYFVDCGLSYDNPTTITGVVVTATEITVTASGHTLVDGDFCHIDKVVGITADGTNTDYSSFNNKKYKVNGVSGASFELEDLDGVALTSADGFGGTYASAGEVRECVKTVSGLDHLEGESIAVCADGMSIGPLTVTSGAITLTALDPGFAVVHAGLGYTCNMQTLRMEISGRNDGTVQGSKKNIHKCTFRFWKSSGGKAGPDADHLLPIKWRQYEEWQAANALTSNDKDITVKGTWGTEGRVYFRQDEPLPSSILAVITYFEVGGR